MNPIRVVLDTNVYIAAALNPQSIIYKIIEDSAAQYLGTYFTSPEILQELQNKLEDKFRFPRATVVRWLNRIEEAVTVVRPLQKINVLSEHDPDDNKILECALEAKADLIITADLDLLSLKKFNNIKIMHTSTIKYLFPQLNDK